MRRLMNGSKDQLQEAYVQRLDERTMWTKQLIEKWSKVPGLDLGKKLYDLYESSPRKAENLAIILENQERYLQSLSETVISNTFAITPQNVVKVIRLGYPNSVANELFTVWGMESYKDTMYKIEKTYTSSERDATAGDVMYENTAHRYGTEWEETTVSVSATDNFTGTLSPGLLRPYKVEIYVGSAAGSERQIAVDNGAGVFSGSDTTYALHTTTASTINYTTGAYDITFASALAATDSMFIRFAFDGEQSDNYDELKQVDINLVAYDFRAHPYPIALSWSKMTEFAMNDKLGTQAEEVLVQAAAEELKKQIDFIATKMAYRASNWTTAVEFNTDFATAGADSDYAHAQSFKGKIREAGLKTYAALMRGGVTDIVCAPNASTYVEKHNSFVANGGQPEIGIYKYGQLGNVNVYVAPTDVVPSGEILCLYKNSAVDNADSVINVGSYVPLYRTPTIEYKNRQKETSLTFFGDIRTVEKRYATRVKLLNL
jgi:hypothetical protein